MDNQNLIIFKFKNFYEIVKEIEENINFQVFEVNSLDDLFKKKNNLKNYIIISQKKINNLDNIFVLDKTPITIFKLIEKLNVQFLKFQFSENSELSIGNYKINLNSRELVKNNNFLRLTEKEVNIIIYLSNSNSPVSINKLQLKVWGYNSKLETHTVETHIYRLRKKIFEKFKDNNFIVSKKDGYQIK